MFEDMFNDAGDMPDPTPVRMVEGILDAEAAVLAEDGRVFVDFEAVTLMMHEFAHSPLTELGNLVKGEGFSEGFHAVVMMLHAMHESMVESETDRPSNDETAQTEVADLDAAWNLPTVEHPGE